jgi:hypothetical protein
MSIQAGPLSAATYDSEGPMRRSREDQFAYRRQIKCCEAGVKDSRGAAEQMQIDLSVHSRYI